MYATSCTTCSFVQARSLLEKARLRNPGSSPANGWRIWKGWMAKMETTGLLTLQYLSFFSYGWTLFLGIMDCFRVHVDVSKSCRAIVLKLNMQWNTAQTDSWRKCSQFEFLHFSCGRMSRGARTTNFADQFMMISVNWCRVLGQRVGPPSSLSISMPVLQNI